MNNQKFGLDAQMVIKWSDRLKSFDEYTCFVWSKTGIHEVSDKGLASANRMAEKLKRNLAVLEYVAGEHSRTDEDIKILRAFYRQTKAKLSEVNDAIEAIERNLNRRLL